MIIAEDDPFIESFRLMGQAGAAQVRILPAVGAEKFAEYIYNKLQEFVSKETAGRVNVVRVEFLEHGRNTAIYEG
jgi:6-pyruvoyltetrahydropterin/6-carboxytetrahydropterin synthase